MRYGREKSSICFVPIRALRYKGAVATVRQKAHGFRYSAAVG